MDKTVYPIQGIVPISILKDMSKVGRRQMDCRRSHGFIIKLRGATEYCCGEKTWFAYTEAEKAEVIAAINNLDDADTQNTLRKLFGIQ